MKPLKDYVEIIFAVLALAGLVFVFWYFPWRSRQRKRRSRGHS